MTFQSHVAVARLPIRERVAADVRRHGLAVPHVHFDDDGAVRVARQEDVPPLKLGDPEQVLEVRAALLAPPRRRARGQDIGHALVATEGTLAVRAEEVVHVNPRKDEGRAVKLMPTKGRAPRSPVRRPNTAHPFRRAALVGAHLAVDVVVEVALVRYALGACQGNVATRQRCAAREPATNEVDGDAVNERRGWPVDERVAH